MPNVNPGVLDGLRRIGGRFRDLTVDGGLPGLPLGFRVRGATQYGPPQTGTHKAGDQETDRFGTTWVCTAGGTGPAATWAQAGPGGVHSAKLQGWFAALANRDYARVNVMCIGDSITEGQGATNADYRWTNRLRDNLRARFPTVGLTGGGRGYLQPRLNAGVTTFTLPWVTITGSTANQSGYSPNDHATLITRACTVTYSLVGDSADIMWIKGGGFGTFSWSVDGGSTTNVSTSGTPTTDGQVTHVSLGTAGAHTLAIAWVSGSVYLDGVVEYNGDYSSGIQVHCGGAYGSSTGSWEGSITSLQYPAAVAALNPGLVIIMLGTNDANTGFNESAAAYQSNMNAVISLVRGAFTTPPPILLVSAYYCTGLGTSLATWQSFIAATAAIAAGDPMIDFLDLSTMRMPANNSGNTWGLYAGDSVHPGNKGHALIADYVTQFLSPA